MNIRSHGSMPGALALLAVASVLLAGCASGLTMRTEPPVLRHHAPPVAVPDVEMLAMSGDMQDFIEKYVLPYENKHTRQYLLALSVGDTGMLDFHYDISRTLTAREAFDSRSGNCIAFANMFIAMARAAGLEANFQQVELEPEWSSRDDTFIVGRHLNVVAGGPGRAYVIDISGRQIRLDARRRILRDHEALALYYNNLGAEALLQGDLPTAYAYFVKAIDTAPAVPDAWSNLGVALNRNGQPEDAAAAYRTALQIDARERAALANLYDLYLNHDLLAAAARLERRVENYRRENPYYLLHLSEEAMAERRFDESMRLLQRAIAKKADEHLLHFAMARSLFLAGSEEAARQSLARARELAPAELQEWYSRSLHELATGMDPESLP